MATLGQVRVFAFRASSLPPPPDFTLYVPFSPNIVNFNENLAAYLSSLILFLILHLTDSFNAGEEKSMECYYIYIYFIYPTNFREREKFSSVFRNLSFVDVYVIYIYIESNSWYHSTSSKVEAKLRLARFKMYYYVSYSEINNPLLYHVWPLTSLRWNTRMYVRIRSFHGDWQTRTIFKTWWFNFSKGRTSLELTCVSFVFFEFVYICAEV